MAAAAFRLCGLRVGDEPAAWQQAGFHVEDGRLALPGLVIELVGADGAHGILGWWLDPAGVGPIDGLAALGAPLPAGQQAADAPRPHPNGVLGLDHLVVASPDLARSAAAFAAVGLYPRRTVDALRGQPGLGAHFFVVGPAVLELVGPTDPAEEHPSPPARFAGLAFTAADLDVVGGGGEVRPAVQPGRWITTPQWPGISVPVAVLSPRVPRGSGQGAR